MKLEPSYVEYRPDVLSTSDYSGMILASLFSD